ncbi:MAG: hypothetical protein ACQESN_09730 [Thermotogota bacterium]
MEGIFIKNLIFLLIILISVFSFSDVYKNEVFLNDQDEWEYYDFRQAIEGTYRGIKYGATMENVARFITPETQEATYLIFNDRYLDRNVEATMFFYEDQLYKINNYYYPGWSPETALKEYDKLKEELTNIYGEPIDHYVYYDNSFLIGKLEYAYKNDQARIETIWENDFATIKTELYRDNNLNHIEITYTSKEIVVE